MFPTNHICLREDFFRLLDLEIKRARRYQNFFSVMRFELQSGEEKTPGNPERGLKSLVELLREDIRETDVIGQTWDNEIMIILPYCDYSGADVVKTRLNSLVRDFQFGENSFKINSALVCFPIEGTDMTEILNRLKVCKPRMTVTGMN
jgi:hypothetical protein